MALLIVNAVVYTVLKSRMMFYDSGTPTALWKSLCSRLSEAMMHCDFLTCYISPETKRTPTGPRGALFPWRISIPCQKSCQTICGYYPVSTSIIQALLLSY